MEWQPCYCTENAREILTKQVTVWHASNFRANRAEQKVINGHKNPSDSHNYHDENHDEIEFYLGNIDRSTWWQSALEQRTPKTQSDWLYGYGMLLTNVQCHRYLYPYHDIENTGTYNWKHTWNHTVSNRPIHQHGHSNYWYVCLLQRVYIKMLS